MIEKVSFRNFKAYRSLDLELEPLTVLVGPNAAGKTTLLQGLHLATSIAGEREGLLPDLDAKVALTSFGVNLPTEWGFEGKWNGLTGNAHITTSPKESKASVNSSWSSEIYKYQARLVREKSSMGFGNTISVQVPAPAEFREAMLSTSILRFDARALADASYSEKKIPDIKGDGSGLASVLAYLKLSQDELFDSIEQALRQIVPSVRRIRIDRAAVEQTVFRSIALDDNRHEVPERQTSWGNRIVLDMKGAKGIAADSAGEGTLMVLGLLTVLMGPAKPRLVLLDDIELGLHPLAQGKLIETLRKLQERDPELQIVATSHSPFILNYLKPEEIRMVFPSENGFARCEKLTAHPEFARWKDMMSPGEFWSTVGESWVAKAGASESHD